MKKTTVKLKWVFWFRVEKWRTDFRTKIRGANYIEFWLYFFRISIGMPWAKAFVEYEVGHPLGIGVKGIEKNNNEILRNCKSIRVYMPSKKYTLTTP